MAATVTIRQAYGGSDGTPGSESTDLTSASTRLQTKDQFAPTDTTYPVPIPSSGNKYSFWIHVYLKIETAPSVKINNIRHSCGAVGWTLGTGGELRRGNRDSGDKGCPMDTEYDVATGTDGDTGDSIEDVTNGHGYYNGQTTKTANLSSETDAVIDSTDHTGTGKSKAIVMQVKTGPTGSPGEQSDVTCTWKYDEI